MKRLAGLILILVLMVLMAIAGAETIIISDGCQQETGFTDAGISREAALEGFINQSFGLETSSPAGKRPLLGGAGNKLDGLEAKMYTQLAECAEQVANGQLESTAFTIPISTLLGKLAFNAEELGVEQVFDLVYVEEEHTNYIYVNEEASNALYGLLSINMEAVVDALLADYPYELYWFDKSKTGGYSYGVASACSVDYENNTIYFITDAYSVSMYVAKEYSTTHATKTTDYDIGYAASIRTAAQNAMTIVQDNDGKTDYLKLKAFKDAICDRVDYNQAAADDDDTPYGNPWQLVWVFDDDASTKVVCEGYSKAFKYLCDMGSLTEASTILVSGTMEGGTGAGRHMWNLVKIQDANFLVDVTNCDEGSIGYPDQLFLVGYSDINDSNGYVYTTISGDITYTYDNSMYNLYAAEDLAVANNPFVEQPMIMTSATEIALGESVTLTVRVPGKDEFHIYQEKDGNGSWIEGPGSSANGQDFLVYTYTPEEEGLYSFYAGYKNATTGTLERTAASVQVNVVYTPPEPITVTGAMKVGTDVTITISKEEEWENLCLEIDYVPNEANRENILREWVVPDNLSVIGTYFQNAGTYQVKLSQINKLEGGGLDYNNPVQLATVNFDMEAQTLSPCPGSISATGIITGDELTYTAEGAEALAYQIWLDEYTTGERVTEMNSPISPDQSTETVSIAYGAEYGAYGFLGGYIWARINGVWTLPKEFQVTVHPLGTLADPIVQWRIDQSVGDSLTLSPGMTTSLAVTAEGADRVFWRLADENGNSIDGGSFEGATGEIDLANDSTAGAEYSLRITPRKLGYQSVDRVIVVRCWDVPTVPEQILPGQDIIVHHNPVEGAVSYNVGLWDMNTGMICYDEDREEPGDFIIPAAAFADGGSYNLGIGVSNGDMGDWLWIDVPYNNVTAYTANTPLTVTPVLERVAGYKNASFILSVESPERVLVQEGVVVDGTSSWGAFLDIVATPGQMVSFASAEYDEFYGNATYRFCALKNGVWTQWSNPVMINVTEGQMMKAADYTPQGTVEQLPADLQRIEEKAFENVPMTEVDIPAGVTSIADDAFDGCGLVAIYTHNNQVAVDFALDHGIIALTD